MSTHGLMRNVVPHFPSACLSAAEKNLIIFVRIGQIVSNRHISTMTSWHFCHRDAATLTLPPHFSLLWELDCTQKHEATFCEVKAEWLVDFNRYNINPHLQQVGSLQRWFIYLNSWLQHLLWLICLQEAGAAFESLIFRSRVASNSREPPRLWGNCFFNFLPLCLGYPSSPPF